MKSGAAKAEDVKPVATNRKAFHDYFIEDRMEAGLVLTGTEVKSLREGRAQLQVAHDQPRASGGCPAEGTVFFLYVHQRPQLVLSVAPHAVGAARVETLVRRDEPRAN